MSDNIGGYDTESISLSLTVKYNGKDTRIYNIPLFLNICNYIMTS